MTEASIQDSLDRLFGNYEYRLQNQYIFQDNWESDWFGISTSGYAYECEVKISRSDFKADFKKEKHALFQNLKKDFFILNRGKGEVHYGWGPEEDKIVLPHPRDRNQTPRTRRHIPALYAEYTKIKFIFTDKLTIPNRFFYAVPEGLIKSEDVPPYAGLIYVTETGSARIEKAAPWLHKRVLNLDRTLKEKFYWKCTRMWYNEADRIYHENKIRELHNEIAKLKGEK